MISKAQRQQQILELLNSFGKLSPKMLSSMLSVSEMTIRRDIKELYDSHQIKTFYGGISLTSPSGPLTPDQNYVNMYHSEEELHLKEKQLIAKCASQMIDPQDVIAIDNGSTCGHIPDFFSPETKCLIYTYSLNVLNKISLLKNEQLRLFAIGGYYHSQLKMFEHTDVLNTIQKFRINKLFLGTIGVSIDGGLSCVQPYEIPIRKALIRQSSKIILLADSSKIGKSWFDHYAPLSVVDTFITDSGISPQQEKDLKNQGLNLIVV